MPSSPLLWHQRLADDRRLKAMGLLDGIPAVWRKRVEGEFWKLHEARESAQALAYVEEIAGQCQGFILPASASEEDLRNRARSLAEGLWVIVCGLGVSDIGAMYWACRGYVERYGIAVPPTPTGELSEIRGAVARMLCADWWRRQLRKRHGRAVEAAAIRLGYVHLRAGKYASDLAVAARVRQKKRNAEALAAMSLENQHGDVFTMAALAERSNANPRIRRAELMTRISGFEAVARGLGHVAEFLTLTCPSKYHAIKAATGEINPAWGEGLRASPREAQEHLNACWQKLRAWMHRRGVRVYGFRIAEPHHDGCPHWHVLLFMEPGAAELVRAACRRYFLDQHDAGEPGAQENRVKFVSIPMTETSSAAGYVIKYVSKNIDGYRVHEDLFGECAVEGAVRVDAWAARWGVRQFQQIGGAPVGVWRELRRLKDEQAGELEAARAAADAGEWAAYVAVQGGPVVKRADLRVVLEKSAEGMRFDPVQGCEVVAEPGRYGDVRKPSVFGVRAVAGDVAVTRRYVWRRATAVAARPVEAPEAVKARAAAGYADVLRKREAFGVCWSGLKGLDFSVLGLGLARPKAAQPWSRVNNCTGGGDAFGAGSGKEGDTGGLRLGVEAVAGLDRDDYRADRSAGSAERGERWREMSGSGM